MTLRLAVVAAVTLTLAIGAPSAADAQECTSEIAGLGVKLLEAPAELADLPRAQVAIFDELEPGATIERRIRFSNGDPVNDLPLAVYATAATVDGGDFAVADGRQPNELTGWMSLSHDQLVLAPCSHDEVTVTLTVPGDADGGERYALIAAEHQPDGEGVAVASRIGVRTYLQVAGPEPARTDLDLPTFTPGRDDLGRPTLTVDLRNPGDRAIDVATEVELDGGPGGARAGPWAAGETPTLAPGEARQVTVTLGEGLPDGPWNATVTARTGEIERAAEATVTFPEVGEGEPVTTSPLQDRGVLIPLALLLLIVALVAWWWAWRRRHDNEPDEDRAAGQPELVGVA